MLQATDKAMRKRKEYMEHNLRKFPQIIGIT